MEGNDQKKYCCAIKQYYSNDVNLVDTLDITPRVILSKKPLQRNQPYEQLITIKNTGIYPRPILCYTDSKDDTELKVFGLEWYQYLLPARTVEITVRVLQKSKSPTNRSRHIFIESLHPNITIEIPIIGLDKNKDFYIPTSICLPRSAPNTVSSYEFVIYNGRPNPNCITIRTMNNCLKAVSETNKVNPKDFIRVIAKLNVQNEKIVTGSMKIRYGADNHMIEYEHEPKVVSLFLSTRHICFEEMKFERENNKEFTICNESTKSIPYELKFESVNERDQAVEEVEDSLRESASSSSYQDSISSEETVQEEKDTEEKVLLVIPDLQAAENTYKLTPQKGEIPAKSSTNISVLFKPLLENVIYGDTQTPPYEMNVKMSLKPTIEGNFEDIFMMLEGTIDGPDMYITPKAIDFREVYLGEEHCERIRITNIDGSVKCKVKFLDYTGPRMAKAYLSPNEPVELEPCQTQVFTFMFFTLIVGKIYFKLRFKTQNGAILNVIVRAASNPVRVKTFPEIVQFGSVPFAVPQKRSVLLMNPLSVPITMQCFLDDGGSEIPLVLNVDDISSLPPVNCRNPILQLIAKNTEDNISGYHDCAELDGLENPSTGNSVSDEDHLSSCTASFRKQVIDIIPKISNDVIANIKAKRYMEKVEPDAKILAEATDKLLALPYFSILNRYNNYACMDWNCIPSDPIEVYFDSEIISLRPNASRYFTVLIVPNVEGYFHRSISIRCCPYRRSCNDDDDINDNPFEMIVDSQQMVTKLWLEYNCRLPHIKWESSINLNDLLYTFQRYNLDIEFENISSIGGFIHFVVVPCSPQGILRFRDNTWKFYIPPMEKIAAKCEVELGRAGNVKLAGMVQVVGAALGLPFEITASVLPTKVAITPISLRRRLTVLEKSVDTFYIRNLTPTVTGIILRLRNEHHQTIDTHGAQMGNGQSTFVTLKTMFPDPETFLNTLYVDLMHGEILEIPLVFIIVGMPIFFEPDITKDYHFGTALLTTETDYESENMNFAMNVRVWNEGERPYTVSFNRAKSVKAGGNRCNLRVVKARISIEPISIYLKPGEEKFISITTLACEKVYLQSGFLCSIVDQLNPKRMMMQSFTLSAEFAPAELNWSRYDIRMKYKRTHKFKQQQQLEHVELINVTDSRIGNVKLRVCGPFKIKGVYEQPFAKEIALELAWGERKLITIELDEGKLRQVTAPFLKGKVYCIINDIPQKSISLRVDISYPDVVIVNSNVVIFTKRNQSEEAILLENVGLLDAEYKWKKLCECQKYVAPYDDYRLLAVDLLSDILRMLDLHNEDPRDDDELCKRNISLCYQKYRCQLAALDDPDNITNIIYEIIENLDFEHKRYQIILNDYSETIADDDAADAADENPSQQFVKETFDEILNKLNLEDTYSVSMPSEDECFTEEHLYFYEKSGVCLAKHGAYSMLHIPGIREGYAMRGAFLLDVVGGLPQKLVVTLANLDRVVDIFPDSMYLSVRPWYEYFKTNFKIYNTTQFNLSLRINDAARIKAQNCNRNYLIDGYACIPDSRIFNLNAFTSHRIKTEGVMGFESEFIRDFIVTINERRTEKFRVRGQGVMPMLLALRTNWPRLEQDPYQIMEEYLHLQRIYAFEMFFDITFVDEELSAPGGEEHAERPLTKELSFSQLYPLSATDEEEDDDDEEYSALQQRIAHNWELLLSTYVVVYNNESLPHASILETLLNVERLKADLYNDSSKRYTLKQIFRKYKEEQSKFDPKIPKNLKYFTVQPLPFEQWGYILEMPNLKINQFRKYFIDFEFFGPGKLTASARTAVKIPGLFVHFEVKNKRSGDFMFYRSADKSPDFFMKRYRNLCEREIDLEINQKLLHAHSFDCEGRCEFHKRDLSTITVKDRKDIKNYYSSLNKSVHLKNKHHFINCTVYTKGRENITGVILRVYIIIKIDKQYYSRDQVFEDYLYIDLHMGPTLPILMRGLIK